MTKFEGDENAKRLCEIGDRAWSNRAPLESLWQTICEQVYPERANYTVSRTEGEEYAIHLFESTPAQNRRDLASALGAILRRRGHPWFFPRARNNARNTQQAKAWLDRRGEDMRMAIYSPHANFSSAMTIADNDFVTIGNAVTSRTENRDRTGFVFQTWHPRDCVWFDDENGVTNALQRKFKISLANKVRKFGEESLSQSDKNLLKKNPYTEIEIRHVVIPNEGYEPFNRRAVRGKPFVSIYYDPKMKKTLREGGYHEFPYNVRRWMRTELSPYAYSPAAMLGIVDARLIQSQAEVILESGERAVDPPWLATKEALLGGVNAYAGAITWVDKDYDWKTGRPVEALTNPGNIGIGLDMKQDAREVHAAAWFLNKLSLPSDKDMTAYETQERVSEYVRSAGPIFEPFEVDNARILDGVWYDLMRFTLIANAAGREGPFGFLEDVPDELSEEEIQYEFDTPLQKAYDMAKASRARETLAYGAEAAEAKQDPTVWDHINVDALMRDGAMAIGQEAAWVNSEEDVQQIRAARQQDQQQVINAEKQAAELEQAGQLVETVPKAIAAAQQVDGALEGVDYEDITGLVSGGGNDGAVESNAA